MKSVLRDSGIKSPAFVIVSEGGRVTDFDLNFPVVIKPVDSQGQRGITVVDDGADTRAIAQGINDACFWSSSCEAIVEEFYQGIELTANAWVKDGKAYNLLVTDRQHFDDSIVLGLCIQHRYPSVLHDQAGELAELDTVVQGIADAFGILNGPLYVQLITGAEGIKVIEFGFRIGGGYETYFVPAMTGVNALEHYVDLVLSGENRFDPAAHTMRYSHGSVNFVLCRSGEVAGVEVPSDLDGRVFLELGNEIGEIENATSRVGYFFIKASSVGGYNSALRKADEGIRILDRNGHDLMYHGIYS